MTVGDEFTIAVLDDEVARLQAKLLSVEKQLADMRLAAGAEREARVLAIEEELRLAVCVLVAPADTKAFWAADKRYTAALASLTQLALTGTEARPQEDKDTTMANGYYEVERTSDDALIRQVWTFWYYSDKHTLFLDTYVEQIRASKRHKFVENRVYNRLARRSPNAITLAGFTIPPDVSEEALSAFRNTVKVGVWPER